MLALRIKKAVRKGATLVVADPRKIWLTKLAKRHLQLRPGTDVWLLNAMMHTILEEGLQDEEYIRDVTDDFDAVREIVERYSPEDAEKITGVPAEDIRATAREYASERHAAIFYTLGITEHACGVDNIWSLSNLVLMTGHLGYESTGLNALRGQNNVQGLNDSGANPSYLPGYQSVDDPEIRRKFSEAWGAEVPDAARLPPRPDRSPASTTGASRRSTSSARTRPRPSRTRATSRRASRGSTSSMSQDIFLNDSTRKYADVVLPASSFAEKDGTFTNTERRISRVRAAAPLPGEAQGRPRDRHRDGEGARRGLARVPGRRVRLERARRPVPELERDPLRPHRGERHAVAVRGPRPPRHAVPACATAGAAQRTRSLLPGRVPAADRGARLRVPVRARRPDARSTTTTRRT